MKQSLKKDVQATVGSIHSLNAPNAIGYLFNENPQGNEVAEGMYCDRVREIDPTQWDWFYSKAGTFYDLRKPQSFKTLMNKFERGGMYARV